MNTRTCKCKSGLPGIMVPTKDRVHCDLCGDNVFETMKEAGEMRSFSGGANLRGPATRRMAIARMK